MNPADIPEIKHDPILDPPTLEESIEEFIKKHPEYAVTPIWDEMEEEQQMSFGVNLGKGHTEVFPTEDEARTAAKEMGLPLMAKNDFNPFDEYKEIDF